MISIAKKIKTIIIILTLALFCASCKTIATIDQNPWQVINLPTTSSILDIGFTPDKQHGWLVGSDSTLLETKDGGQTWELKKLELGEQKYRFTSVSFFDDEGWIVGEPSILLHTTNGGQNWENIPLSNQLPGAPNLIVATGQSQAEMVTTVGAIYQTSDSGHNWKALVEEALGVLRNVERSPDGKYIAVSSRGNFYSIWHPGKNTWTGYNRNSSRRLQNMGFGQDNRLWMLARGGQLQFSQPEQEDQWLDPIYPEYATSWGLLDLEYRTPNELWVVGGSGTILRSIDNGQTWQKDADLEEIPSNFDRIIFLDTETGYILGQRGIILKYNNSSKSA